jgi:hypothetical protein
MRNEVVAKLAPESGGESRVELEMTLLRAESRSRKGSEAGNG